jgi:hypothetical protein
LTLPQSRFGQELHIILRITFTGQTGLFSWYSTPQRLHHQAAFAHSHLETGNLPLNSSGCNVHWWTVPLLVAYQGYQSPVANADSPMDQKPFEDKAAAAHA